MKNLRPIYIVLTMLPAFFVWRAQATGGDFVKGLLIGVLLAGALLMLVKIGLSFLGGRRFKRLYDGLVDRQTPPQDRARLIDDLTAMMAGRAGILACLRRHAVPDAEAQTRLRQVYQAVVDGGGDVIIHESYVPLSAICDPTVLEDVLGAENKAAAAMAAVQRQYDNITLRGRKIDLK